MMTREAAWMSFDDQETGSLELGKCADMVILDRNPLAVSKDTLKSIAVEELVLKGKTWSGVGTLPGVILRGLL
jgi:predicted amidohydrolase YtcJ